MVTEQIPNNVSTLLQEYQTGVPVQEKEEEITVPPQSYTGAFYQRHKLPASGLFTTDTQVAQEAAGAGWGESRFDRGEFVPGDDLEEKRALEQSGFNKILAGIAKGGVTAATTAVNTTLGTVFGAGSALFSLASSGGEGNEKTVSEIVGDGVNNWLSEELMKIQTKSEEWFPNYRTQEERSDKYQQEWYKHILTPNFIGDSILKNFGFTVGAIAGGVAWSKGIGALMRSSLANNLMKGVAAAAEGDAVANEGLTAALAAFKNGKATAEDIELITRNIQNAGRQINSLNPRLQLYGSMLGAMGEGTTEGIMAKNEYLEDALERLNQQYMYDYNQSERKVIERLGGTDAVRYILDDSGNTTIELNDKGKQILEDTRLEMAEEYRKRREFIEKQGDELAKTTYLLNLPVLTVSNVVQFGKMFSGGFKTAKNVKGLTGGIDVLERTGAGYMPNKLVGEYAAKTNAGIKSVLGSLKVAGTEAAEEMSQGAISSGAKNVASNRVAAFNNDAYDPDVMESTRNWFADMYAGGREYLSDTKNWQEGFLGALTGLFGIPGRVWKGEWNGGLIGEIKQANEEQRQAQDAADKLNKLVNSEEFQNRWRSYVRHLKYDNEMAEAAKKNDSYKWHTASDKQLVNDVIAFADLGRIEDLQSVVDAYASIPAQQIPHLKEILVTDKKVKDNISNKEVLEKVQERAAEIQDAIKSYKDTYDALSSIINVEEIPDYTKELIFTRMQMKNLEKRFLSVYDELLAGIKPKVSLSEKEEDSNLYNQMESVGNRYKDIFLQNKDYTPDARLVNDTNVILDGFQSKTKWDEDLRQKAKDLGKLYNARKEYYDKYQYLKSAQGKIDFVEQAINQAKVNEAAAKAADKLETEGVETIEQMHAALAQSNDKGKFIESMRTKAKDNKDADAFVKLFDTYNGYRHYLFEHAPTIRNNKTGGFSDVAEALLNDLFQSSKSEEDFVNKLTEAQFDYNTAREQVRDKFPDAEYDMLVNDLFNKAVQAITGSAQEYKDSWKKSSGIENTKPEKKEEKLIDDNEPVEPTVTPTVQPEVKPEPEKKVEEQKEEKQEDENVEEPVEKVNAEEVEEDSLSAFTDTSLAEKDSYWKDEGTGLVTLGYYQQSIPEIAVERMGRIRELLKRRKTANRDFQNEIDAELEAIDRSDFVIFDKDGNPVRSAGFDGEYDFSENFKYLKDNNAFRYIAEDLDTGDELVFAILPDAPKYEGRDQIIVAKVTERNNDGEITDVQPLTFLHSEDREGKASDYMNLDSLYSSILADYESQSPEGSMYIFGGRKNPITSKVFDKRPGIIRYNKTGNDSDYERIDQIDSYSATAPIMIIDEHNQPVLLRGNVDKNKIFMPNIYPWSENHYGRLYYLVKNGNDTYTPILLDKDSVMMSDVVDAPDGSILGDLKNVLGGIDKITNTVTPDSITESNDILNKRLGELTKLLNIDGLKFEYIDNKGDLGLYILAKDGNGMREVARVMPGESIMPLLDNVLHRPVRISPKEKWLEQSKKNLDAMIKAGKIVSNAKELRQAGVNFLFNPWDGKSSFKQLLSRNTEEAKQKPIEAGKQVRVETDADFGEIDIVDFVGDEEFSKKNEVKAENIKTEEPVEDTNTYKNFDSLSNDEKAIIAEKGYTEENKKLWNERPKKFKDRVLGCG